MSTPSQSDTCLHWKPEYNLAFVPQTSAGKTTSSVLIPGARAHNTDHLYLWPQGLALSHTHCVLIGGTCQMCKLCLDVRRKHDGKPCLTKPCGATDDDISAFFLRKKQWSEREVYRDCEDTRLHPPVRDRLCFSCNPRQRLDKSPEDSAQTLTLERVCAEWTLWNPPPPHPRPSWWVEEQRLTSPPTTIRTRCLYSSIFAISSSRLSSSQPDQRNMKYNP